MQCPVQVPPLPSAAMSAPLLSCSLTMQCPVQVPPLPSPAVSAPLLSCSVTMQCPVQVPPLPSAAVSAPLLVTMQCPVQVPPYLQLQSIHLYLALCLLGFDLVQLCLLSRKALLVVVPGGPPAGPQFQPEHLSLRCEGGREGGREPHASRRLFSARCREMCRRLMDP
jgi:hypothetical protein